MGVMTKKGAKLNLNKLFSIKDFFLRQKRMLFILLAILLLLLIIFYLVGLQVRFVLKEEMTVDLSPTEASFTVLRSNPPVVNFSTQVTNPAVCRASCSFKLTDLSDDKILYQESVVDTTTHFHSALLSVPKTGIGQKMFTYTVHCNNVKTAFCSSTQKEYFKTALITVNYVYSPREKELKDSLKYQITDFVVLLDELNSTLYMNEQLISQLTLIPNSSLSVEEQSFISQQAELVSTLNKFYSLKKILLNLWDEQEFNLLNSMYLSSQSLTINQTNEVALSLQNNIIKRIHSYNLAIDSLLSLFNKTSEFDVAATYFTSHQDAALLVTVNKTFNSLLALSNTILLKNFTSFASLSEDVYFVNVSTQTLFDEYHLSFDELNNSLSSQRNSLISFSKFLSSHAGEYNVSALLYPNKSFAVNMPFLNRTCLLSSNIFEQANTFQDNVSSRRNSFFPKFVFENPILSSILDDYKEYVLSEINSPSNNSFLLNYSVFSVNNSELNVSYMINISKLGESFLASVSYLPSSLLNSSYDVYCRTNVSFVSFNQKNMSVNLFAARISLPKSNSENYSFNLKDQQPTCCMYGVCSPCCTNDTCKKYYPVIFVHGHALSKENTPERSHEAFSLIQNLLENKGYINAGQIGADNEIVDLPFGDWGKMPNPISVRLSYYVLAYHDLGSYQLVTHKSDSIENYAIRLHDLIEVVKERTGRDKVIIVAHSMGGLVAREYVALFGDDSVHKMILLGTPNHGIEGRVKRLCSVTGASRECHDMYANSIFLKRLNNPKNDITDIEVHTVTAIGCDMNGRDGDGVVLASSVPLDFATNHFIKGECTDALNSNLHTSFLNPKKYPETYALLVSLLKD